VALCCCPNSHVAVARPPPRTACWPCVSSRKCAGHVRLLHQAAAAPAGECCWIKGFGPLRVGIPTQQPLAGSRRENSEFSLGWIDCSTAALQQLECSSRIASSHRSSQQPSAQQFRPDSEAQRGGSHTEGGRGGRRCDLESVGGQAGVTLKRPRRWAPTISSWIRKSVTGSCSR
jgi:hypothetical protein